MVSDGQLIARVLGQQDQHAYAQLVLRYQSSVRRWTLRLCDGDAHPADDLAQETFIKSYTALASFRGDAKFSTWLYRIAFNLAASRKRSLSQACINAEVGEAEIMDSGSLPRLDARADLENALQQLTEPEQLAIRLALEEGFSHGEMAEIMDIPLDTVKTHVLRGKQKLRILLACWNEVSA